MEQANDLFVGTAENYARYRVPYPQEVFDWIVDEYRLDGCGRLLDAGCGTGQLALPLSGWFDNVIAVDPDQEMLTRCERAAHDRGIVNVSFLNARTEDLPDTIAPLRLATFGASLHWMDRVRVADRLQGLMESGGGLVAVSPSSLWRGREPWQQAVIQTIRDCLGEERRAGAGVFKATPLHQECLAQTAFADIKVTAIHQPHIWTADSIVGYIDSTSFASRAVLGHRRDAFETDLRERLSRLSGADRFAEEIEFSIVSARVAA